MQVGDRPTGGAVRSSAVGWSVLLPDNWFHIPLDESRRRRVAALLRQTFSSLPRDAVFPWRRELEQQINSLTDDALAEGGSDVYLLVDPRYGLPLAATCLASLVPIPLPADVPAELLARTLANRDGDRPLVLLVEGQDCAAIQREESAVIEDDARPAGSASAPAPATLTVTCLDVFIPFPGDASGPSGPSGPSSPSSPSSPGSERMLLLSFRTPVEAVAEPMMMLFEAIAESLRWKWET
jgi:hypothetical protein